MKNKNKLTIFYYYRYISDGSSSAGCPPQEFRNYDKIEFIVDICRRSISYLRDILIVTLKQKFSCISSSYLSKCTRTQGQNLSIRTKVKVVIRSENLEVRN
jgi:hypothetical protein